MGDSCEATIAHPQRIGRYRVSNVLGSGAMGVVYLGYDDAIERQVAIKTVHQHLLRGEYAAEWLARFRHEVRAAGRCLHPNIVTIFEYGEHEGIPYIVMEYVQGRELRDYTRDRRPLPPASAVAIVVQVLQALGHAHAGGVVHRDIKPGNIILLAGGQVKVTDFGIARLDTAMGITQVGMALGTPSHMSPEQFQGQEADRRSDLFAVGVVLFELLTGVRPFQGRNASELMYQLLNEPPRRVTHLNPALPPEFDAVFDKALAKLPDQRFQNAGEFIAALESLGLEGQGDAAGGPATVRVALPQVPEPTSAILPGWDPALLGQASKQLAVYLGPVAKVLVRKAALQASGPAALVQSLAEAIPGEADRLMFRRQMQAVLGELAPGTAFNTALGPVATTTGNPSAGRSQMSRSLGSFEQALLETVRRDLAVHLGPIAKLLVKQTAIDARTVEDLYERLAQHIPGPAGRAEFLTRGEEAQRQFTQKPKP